MHNYQILGVIGQGAYGVVLKARNRVTNKLVAIKKFKQSDDHDEAIRKIILREIKVLKSLSASNIQKVDDNTSQIKKKHHIVELLQAFKKKGIYYLVFEYYDNNVLEIMQKSKHGVERHFIARYIYQLLKGLKFMHSNNYVHRDIKPENLLVNSQHIIKICDMGFARSYHPSQKLTEYVATRWYRSPQLLLGVKYNFPIDVWATGCLMAELVDGNPLFPGSDELDQVKQIQQFFGATIRKSGQKNKLVIMDRKRNHEHPNNISYGYSMKIASVNLSRKYQQKIGQMGVNLLKRMLQLLPQKRITAAQSLKHPFFDEIREQFQDADEESSNVSHRKADKVCFNEEGSLYRSTNQKETQSKVFQKGKQLQKIEQNSPELTQQLKSKGQNKIHTRNSSDLNSISLAIKLSNSNSKTCAQGTIMKNEREIKEAKVNEQKYLIQKLYENRTNRTDFSSSIRGLFRVKKQKCKEEQKQNQKRQSYLSNLKSSKKMHELAKTGMQSSPKDHYSFMNEQKTARDSNNRHRNLDYYKTSYERISGQSSISNKFLAKKIKDMKFQKTIKSNTDEDLQSCFSLNVPHSNSIQGRFFIQQNRKKSKNQANMDYYHNKLYGQLKSKYRQNKNQSISKPIQKDLQLQQFGKQSVPSNALSNRLKNFRTKLGF